MAATTLLSYWDFNNTATNYSGSLTGSFATTNAGFGEVFNTTNNRLSSNTANGALYTSTYIDFTGVTGYINGGHTNTYSQWGAFNDASTNLGSGQNSNLYAGDTSTQQGAAFLVLSSTTAAPVTSSLVFSLDTQGYQGISLSYAGRTGGSALTSLTWAYSYDNVTFTTVTPTQTGTLTLGGGYFDISDTFSTVLDNKSAVYLKLVLNETGNGTTANFALDNVQVLGTALAVPEPPVWELLIGALGAALFVRARARRVEA